MGAKANEMREKVESGKRGILITDGTDEHEWGMWAGRSGEELAGDGSAVAPMVAARKQLIARVRRHVVAAQN